MLDTATQQSWRETGASSTRSVFLPSNIMFPICFTCVLLSFWHNYRRLQGYPAKGAGIHDENTQQQGDQSLARRRPVFRQNRHDKAESSPAKNGRRSKRQDRSALCCQQHHQTREPLI